MHLMQLAEEVKRGVEEAGLVGYRCGPSSGLAPCSTAAAQRLGAPASQRAGARPAASRGPVAAPSTQHPAPSPQPSPAPCTPRRRRFNTIGVSDGISMGTDGMSYSLQSRDLIADSIETVMGAQWWAAVLASCGDQLC
jgi:hypothetical protein